MRKAIWLVLGVILIFNLVYPVSVQAVRASGKRETEINFIEQEEEPPSSSKGEPPEKIKDKLKGGVNLPQTSEEITEYRLIVTGIIMLLTIYYIKNKVKKT